MAYVVFKCTDFLIEGTCEFSRKEDRGPGRRDRSNMSERIPALFGTSEFGRQTDVSNFKKKDDDRLPVLCSCVFPAFKARTITSELLKTVVGENIKQNKKNLVCSRQWTSIHFTSFKCSYFIFFFSRLKDSSTLSILGSWQVACICIRSMIMTFREMYLMYY